VPLKVGVVLLVGELVCESVGAGGPNVTTVTVTGGDGFEGTPEVLTPTAVTVVFPSGSGMVVQLQVPSG
jgi:hypothetical protein